MENNAFAWLPETSSKRILNSCEDESLILILPETRVHIADQKRTEPHVTHSTNVLLIVQHLILLRTEQQQNYKNESLVLDHQ